ncbi:MAG: hypothetical protein ACT4OY_00090 [Alphaproteobacteria bacterium]
MTRKKHKKIIADETSSSKQAASHNYGKTSGDISPKVRRELGSSSS